MPNIFISAGIVSVVFFFIKFIEMRFVDKESKPLKFLIRDSLLVYFSVISGNFIMDQLSPMMEEGAMGDLGITRIRANPAVFTDNPGF